MATLEKKAMLGRDKFFSKIRAFPENAWDRTECFDSELLPWPSESEIWKIDTLHVSDIPFLFPDL